MRTSILSLALIASLLGTGSIAPAMAQVAAGRDVVMTMTPRQTSVSAGDQIQVDLFLSNPSKKALTSVEALISYDPAQLRGVSVTYPAQSPFEINLLSSGENEFQASSGQARISRATLKDTSLVPDTTYTLATFVFEATGSGSTSLDFIKTQSGLERVTANATVEGISTNIVDMESLKPISITLGGTRSSAVTTTSGSTVNNIFSSNANSNTSAGNTNTNVAVTGTTTNANLNGNANASVVNTNTNTSFAGLSNTNTNSAATVQTNANTNTNAMPTVTFDAPRDIAIKKMGKSISLYWSNNTLASATYIYYGTKADTFSTRKKVLYPDSSFTFSGMPTKGTYYFVLTHVDANGKESAYTPMFTVDGTKDAVYYENDSYLTKIADRAGLIATSVLTTAISDQARASLAKVPTMPENGPAEMLLILLLLSLGAGAFWTFRTQTSR
ncbi:hypothetical protein COW46_01960 [Candidatus Gracilibacteria bacterium CG17_big_fil_post_rev_8_21_14_2_50_48_13]|nr:MAG: hypothetical protein COW46_01960 [Candidatus Gracilibacteria bacterium CG17_big_fil_post_rev_8_21_14_2_50_48_13]